MNNGNFVTFCYEIEPFFAFFFKKKIYINIFLIFIGFEVSGGVMDEYQ